MKKVKKIFAIIMTLAMIMGLGMTAMAAKTGASIIVNGLSTNGSQKVTIYEIYRLDANDNGWVKASWVPESITPSNLTDSKSLSALKTAALDTTGVGVSQNTSTGIATFSTDIQVGAYLVLVEDTTGKVEYSTMVAETWQYGADGLIAAKTKTVVAKAEHYTTDKKQNPEVSGDDAVVEVGDLVTFQITTTVPYNDGSINEFKVTDTISGATFYISGEAVKGVDPVNSITLNEVPYGTIQDNNISGNTLEIDFSSLINADNTNAGKTIVIKYTAKVTAVDEVTNTASSTNDPDGTATHTYTGQAKITKYASDNNNTELADNQKLAGAKFAIYRVKNTNTREYAVIDSNGYITGQWMTVTAGTDGQYQLPEGVSTVTTDTDGVATVKGLDVGTYYFDEVVAPDGYSVNTEDKVVEVEKSENSGKVTVFGETNMVDSTLANLPGTGGIGTTIFTIGGIVIMIAAAALFFANRRKNNAQ